MEQYFVIFVRIFAKVSLPSVGVIDVIEIFLISFFCVPVYGMD